MEIVIPVICGLHFIFLLLEVTQVASIATEEEVEKAKGNFYSPWKNLVLGLGIIIYSMASSERPFGLWWLSIVYFLVGVYLVWLFIKSVSNPKS